MMKKMSEDEIPYSACEVKDVLLRLSEPPLRDLPVEQSSHRYTHTLIQLFLIHSPHIPFSRQCRDGLHSRCGLGSEMGRLFVYLFRLGVF